MGFLNLIVAKERTPSVWNSRCFRKDVRPLAEQGANTMASLLSDAAQGKGSFAHGGWLLLPSLCFLPRASELASPVSIGMAELSVVCPL